MLQEDQLNEEYKSIEYNPVFLAHRVCMYRISQSILAVSTDWH